MTECTQEHQHFFKRAETSGNRVRPLRPLLGRKKHVHSQLAPLQSLFTPLQSTCTNVL